MAKRIRITRTLVYEGDEYWVHETLAKGYVTKATPLTCGKGTIVERSRIEDPLAEDSPEEVKQHGA
jgi:hypothetical protein